MEVSRRTRISKTKIFRTISKLKAEVSVEKKRGHAKNRVINKKDTISLAKLAQNNRHMSIRKLTCNFNTTRSKFTPVRL